MIDGQDQQAAARVTRPAGGEMQQGEGVAAAGQGEGQRPVGAAIQTPIQPLADAGGPGREVRAQPPLRAGQAKRVRNSPARVRRAALPPSA